VTLSISDDYSTTGKTKQESLDEIRDKLAFHGKTKVSLEVSKNVASDYLQTADEETTIFSFKKPKKLVGKKRTATEQEDIIAELEKRGESGDGLGTREDKLK
jgi:hypothetical protein